MVFDWDGKPDPKQHEFQTMPFTLMGEEWKNWCDLRIYEIDIMFRDWFYKSCTLPTWRKRRWGDGFKTYRKIVAEYLGLESGRDLRILSSILGYYATTRKDSPHVVVGHKGSLKEGDRFPESRKVAKTGYILPYKVLREPYSLKLRWEKAIEEGKFLTAADLTDPKKKVLKKAGSRDKITKVRMKEKSKAYYERNKDKEWRKNDPTRWENIGFPGAERTARHRAEGKGRFAKKEDNT